MAVRRCIRARAHGAALGVRTVMGLIVGLGVGLAVAPSARAITLGGAPYQGWQSRDRDRIDANTSGAITRGEVVIARKTLFARLDGNRDGSLDEDEFSAHRRDRVTDGPRTAQARRIRAMRFRHLDGNGDGRIDRREFIGAALVWFARADTDRDGRVTPAERRRARLARRNADRNRAFARLDRNADNGVDAGEFTIIRNRVFARIDANGDGRVTRQEFLGFRAHQGADRNGQTAPQRRARRNAMFARLDRDGSGAISRREFLVSGQPRFRWLDRDGNGRLSRGEFRRPGTARVVRLFRRADRNVDGAISRDEFAAARARVFARLDHDGDGVIERAEFIDHRSFRTGARRPRDGLPEGRRRAQARRRAAWFQRLDRDGSGDITRAEFQAGSSDLYARLDRNGDGRLTRDELSRRRR